MKLQPAECRDIIEGNDGVDYLVTIERDEDGDTFVTLMLEDWMRPTGTRAGMR